MRFKLLAAVAVVASCFCAGATHARATTTTNTYSSITSSRSAADGGDVSGEGYTLPGDVLTAQPVGTGPFAYQWSKCTSTFSSCNDVLGATAASYSVVSGDTSFILEVRITDTSDSSQSSAVRRPAVGAPLIQSQSDGPYVSTDRASDGGTNHTDYIPYIAQGDTLTVQPGTWIGSPTGYSYQWERCDFTLTQQNPCSDISGATSATYVVQAADLNLQLYANVTGANTNGSSQWTAYNTQNHTGVPVVDRTGNTYARAITSNANSQFADAGDTLSAVNGNWIGDPTSFAYQWQDCDSNYSCAPITNATAASYLLQSSDRGSNVSVVISATNAAGTGTTTGYFYDVVGSPAVAAADGSSPAMSANGSPVDYTMTVGPGDVLSVTNGVWDGAPTSYSYSWKRCSNTGCSAIAGEAGSSYTVTANDDGAYVTGVVHATNAYGSYDGWANGVQAGSVALGSGGSGSSSAPAAPAAPVTTTTADSASMTIAASTAGTLSLPTAAGATPAPTVSWSSPTFTSPVTVSVTLIGAATQGGQRTVSGFSAGSVSMTLLVTDAAGNQLHHFPAPLDVVFASPAPGFQPAYSEDGITWVAIPKLSGTSLPAGQQDGYYTAANGAVHVLTMHATYFGLLTGLSLWGGTKSHAKHTAKSIVVHLATGRTSVATVSLVNHSGRTLRTVKTALGAGGKALKLALPAHLKRGTYRIRVKATSGVVTASKTFVVRLT